MKRIDIILLLLKEKSDPIIGTTRLQKLLFLTEKEKHVLAEDSDFEFVPYNYGPCSKKLYNDLEFLSNMGYIQKSGEVLELKVFDDDNIESMSAKDFLSDCSNDSMSSSEDLDDEIVLNEDDSVVYRITDDGIRYLQQQNLFGNPEFNKIESIKKLYSKQPLQALLRYVYSHYKEFITESLIRDEVL